MYDEMMRAEIWLQEQLESQQGIEDLAGRLGYSTSQVRRRFKQCFGLSPSAYRDTLRLEKAAQLLAFTPYPIHTIARRCGYLNHSAFSRAFQRLHELTPRQFRRAFHARLYANAQHRPRSDSPRFLIRRLEARQALVSRLYHYKAASLFHTLQHWADAAKGADALPERLRQAPAIALLHNMLLPCRLDKIDIGTEITTEAATGMAIPWAFRVVELPAQEYACAHIDDEAAIATAAYHLISDVLPSRHAFTTGEAIALIDTPKGVEMQVPVFQE